MKILWPILRTTLLVIAGYAVLALWCSLYIECGPNDADAQVVTHYTPPDSLIPWCYDGFTGPAAWRFPGISAQQLKSFGIFITCDARKVDGDYYRNHGQYSVTMIPLALADDTIEPVHSGWPDVTNGVGRWQMPQGMPDLYYQCVAWILNDDFEGHLHEQIADGAWHYNSLHIPNTIEWDCCPPSLWPHPSGCVRILDRWYQDPDTLYWDHWQWQILFGPSPLNGAMGWQIVGGLPGGGWWSPHLGPWVQSQIDGGQR